MFHQWPGHVSMLSAATHHNHRKRQLLDLLVADASREDVATSLAWAC